MDVETQQRNIDIQVCLRILKNRGNGIKAQKVKLKDHFVIVSSKYRQVGYYVIGQVYQTHYYLLMTYFKVSQILKDQQKKSL